MLDSLASKTKLPWQAVLFVVTACFNFAAGTLLGLLMAIHPSWIPTIVAVHITLNVYGWLTLLIYGMTFAVLTLMLGLKLTLPRLVWYQWGLAELSVVAYIIGITTHGAFLAVAGSWCAAAAPVLFLIQILAGVRHKRRTGSQPPVRPALPYAFGSLTESLKPSDRVARRGTDLVLMMFIATTLWVAVHASVRGEPWPFLPGTTAQAWIFYGWIAGTAVHVALHLVTRYRERVIVHPWSVLVFQAMWGVALLLWLFPAAADIGNRVMGAAWLWIGAAMLVGLPRALHRIPAQIRTAWYGSWLFCAFLGVRLLSGADPLAPAEVHSLFLGWITLMAYGVAYTLFPAILGRAPRWPRWPVLQVAVAVGGAVLMVVALEVAPERWLLAVGGSLSFLAAWMFFLIWLTAGKSQTD